MSLDIILSHKCRRHTPVTENCSDSLCSSNGSGDEVEITNVSNESSPELDALVEDFQQAVKSHAAAWILKTKEGHKLTQTAVDDIIEVTALNLFIVLGTHRKWKVEKIEDTRQWKMIYIPLLETLLSLLVMSEVRKMGFPNTFKN